MDDQNSDYANFVHLEEKPFPRIGNDVWIGLNVSLMPGIVVGDGSVIAANSVVTKDVLPYSIVGGNPARLIRMRFRDDVIERLLILAWWQYKFIDFKSFDISEPDRFIDQCLEKKLAPYQPLGIKIKELVEPLHLI